MTQKITTSLWFDKEAEEAMNFYVDTFNDAPKSSNNSKIIHIEHYPENASDPHLQGMNGKVINGEFELEGQRFTCLDGGPLFKFNESISLTVDVDSQEEVDYFWDTFTNNGGEESQCGWLKDKYGLSWQIVPKKLGELAGSQDKAAAMRTINAMMKMKKIIIADLEKAYAGEE